MTDLHTELARLQEDKACLQRQLAEERIRAEFAADQLEVAIKDRDHAERQLAEVRAAIVAALNELEEAPTGPNDPFIVAAFDRLRSALQDRAPAPLCQECEGRGRFDTINKDGRYGPLYPRTLPCPECGGAVSALSERDGQWIRGHVEGRSPTTGNGDEP